jgi:hypothetical protein
MRANTWDGLRLPEMLAIKAKSFAVFVVLSQGGWEWRFRLRRRLRRDLVRVREGFDATFSAFA